jgi:hypothetical protein
MQGYWNTIFYFYIHMLFIKHLKLLYMYLRSSSINHEMFTSHKVLHRDPTIKTARHFEQ